MISFNQIKLFLRVSIFTALFSIGILNTFQCKRNNIGIPEIIPKIDTLYLHDTIRFDKPIPNNNTRH